MLSRRTGFSINEALIELIIFGIAFPLLAWLDMIRTRPLTIRVHPTAVEMLALLAYVFVLSVYLAFGPQTLIYGCRKIGSLRTGSDFRHAR